MPAAAPWDAETARACGIDWLLAATAPAGPLGAALRARRAAFVPGDEARAHSAIAEVVAFAAAAGADGLAAFRHEVARAPDVTAGLRRAQAGERLDDPALFEMLVLLSGLEAIVAIADARRITLDTALDLREAAAYRALRPAALPGGGFYLGDAFDSGLAAARDRSRTARVRADLERSRLERIVAEATGRAVVPPGEFVVMRDAAPVPLPSGLRVVREAPSYLLCELALDGPALAALAALADAEAVEAEREDAIRARLTAAIAADAGAIGCALTALATFDLLVAHGTFAFRTAGCTPAILTDRSVRLTEICYLPISDREGYAPIDLVLDDANVLTGPNMGGKTTALRTLGFASACVSLGLPVPAREARLPLFGRVRWLAPSEADTAENGLSSFGREIVRAVEVVHESAAGGAWSLVLIDEFARTTTPREGRALLAALIAGLRERGALVFAATHANGVATACGATSLAVTGLRTSLAEDDRFGTIAEAIAAVRERMDFHIIRVDGASTSRSDAIALARALGLDRALAAHAARIFAETPA